MLLPFPEESRRARGLRTPRRLLSHVDPSFFLAGFPGGRPPTVVVRQVSSAFPLPQPPIPSIAVPNSTSPALVNPVNALNDDQRKAAAALLRRGLPVAPRPPPPVGPPRY